MLLWLLACTSPAPTDDPLELAPVQVTSSGEGFDLARWRDGAVISWVEDDGEERTAHLAHLQADGRLSDPVELPITDPVVGLARRPQLAADDQRLLITWSTGDPRSSAVHVADAPNPSGPFTTTLVATGSAAGAITFVDQPDVHLSPEGEAWIGYKAEVDHPIVELRIARESSGWVPTTITPSGGVPCECCPHALRFLPGGDAWLVLRGNEANVREIHEARLQVASPASPGRDLSLDHTTQVSRTGWWVQGCPFDGPDGVALDDVRRLATWVDPTSGASTAWVAATTDDGTTWSDAQPIFGDDARLDQQPQLTLLADGRAVAAVDDYWTGSAVVVAPEDAWSATGPVADQEEAIVLSPSRPLWEVVLVPWGEGLLLAGHDEEGAVWIEVLDVPR